LPLLKFQPSYVTSFVQEQICLCRFPNATHSLSTGDCLLLNTLYTQGNYYFDFFVQDKVPLFFMHLKFCGWKCLLYTHFRLELQREYVLNS